METSMRSFKVEIIHNGSVVHTSEVTALASSEARDEAWRLFDPERKISIFDGTYATTTAER